MRGTYSVSILTENKLCTLKKYVAPVHGKVFVARAGEILTMRLSCVSACLFSKSSPFELGGILVRPRLFWIPLSKSPLFSLPVLLFPSQQHFPSSPELGGILVGPRLFWISLSLSLCLLLSLSPALLFPSQQHTISTIPMTPITIAITT